MPSRASLESQARSLGIDPATYPNDSTLEQRVIYQQKRATANTGTQGTGTITSDATAPLDGETVTIGDRTYTYKTALTVPAVANEVLIGGTAAIALANLKKAIDNTGTPGTEYSSGTTINPDVSGSTLTATTLVVLARNFNTAVATTETSIHLSWGGATLASAVPKVLASTEASVRGLSGGAPV